jgi:hypothetical protein
MNHLDLDLDRCICMPGIVLSLTGSDSKSLTQRSVFCNAGFCLMRDDRWLLHYTRKLEVEGPELSQYWPYKVIIFCVNVKNLQ